MAREPRGCPSSPGHHKAARQRPGKTLCLSPPAGIEHGACPSPGYAIRKPREHGPRAQVRRNGRYLSGGQGSFTASVGAFAFTDSMPFFLAAALGYISLFPMTCPLAALSRNQKFPLSDSLRS